MGNSSARRTSQARADRTPALRRRPQAKIPWRKQLRKSAVTVLGPATIANGLSMVLVMTAAHGWGPVASWWPASAAVFVLQFALMAFVNDFGGWARRRRARGTFGSLRFGWGVGFGE